LSTILLKEVKGEKMIPKKHLKGLGTFATVKVIEDECAIGLRAMNLTNLPWLSCHPPSTEAAITDHWPKPRGCD
jgi:hypothetical protein